MKRPTGITILGILYILGGIVMMLLSITLGLLSSVLLDSLGQNSISMLFGSVEYFLTSSIFAIVLGIIAIIQFIIAGALFSGKNWGRTTVIIFAISDLVFETISLFVGNAMGIIFLMFDTMVLYYMWRPHVLAYFKGINVASSQQFYNPSFSQNSLPYTPPNMSPDNQYSEPSIPPPNPFIPENETQIYTDEQDVEINIPPQKICQKCQTEISLAAKFCQKCGDWI
ncbi:MAG: zinc ribbon domain-containing protein [Candidatus Nitrosopelagicus sp.]|jgi:hypothetical protein|nr:zinc ribbon domain-containing protein [Candidatus Nitrosopelagicus sp.]